MNIEIPELKCSIVIEHHRDGCMVSKSSIPKCQLTLCRNQNGDCVLSLNDLKKSSRDSKRYTFGKTKGNYQLNTKFVNEGKCSILLPEYNQRLFISDCPSNDLSLFLKGFSLKCLNNNAQQNKSELFVRHDNLAIRSNKSRCSNIEKISPLTGNDFIKAISFRDRTNLPNTENRRSIQLTSPLAPKGTNIHKRKLETILEQISESSPKTKKKILSSMIPSPVCQLKVLNTTDLTDDQSKVVNAVLSGQSVFFTGSAGTGKSYLLKFLISRLPPNSTFVTASTGIAACQIQGITLHLFSGIPSNWLEEMSIQDEVRKLTPQEVASRLQKNELKVQRWRNCKCLIIDEISMVSGDYFQMLDQVARIIRNKPDQAFGGIQMVVCGDFLQLPPISKKEKKKQHSFQTKAWQESIKYSFELRRIRRQTDKNFINFLQMIRVGRMNSHVKATMIKASQNDLQNHSGMIPTKLFPLRQDVDAVNSIQLMKLKSQSYYFTAEDSSPIYTQMLDSLCPTPRKLELKIGAQVMLNKNLDLNKGLVNGLTGVIIRFENESPNSSQLLPRIRFHNGIETTINYDKWSFRFQDNNNVYRRHLPLQLAWALSVHKSQGMTITNGVEISLAKIFESGQAYVALSRSTCLENIKILDFNMNNIIVDEDALQFYRQLKYVV